LAEKASETPSLLLVDEQYEQRSPEWFEWRKLGIGSSEAPVLMGYDKYCKIDELWRYKTGLQIREPTFGYMAERGTRLEPAALRAYQRHTKLKMVDRLFTHKKYKFIRASLDGWNEEFEIFVEIKCPNRTNHYRAVAENWIKPEYYTQIQHQFLASGAKYADFWSYDGRSGHKIPVLPNPWFMGELLEREILFWNCVENRVEPDPSAFKEIA